jgi:hypothetical protein
MIDSELTLLSSTIFLSGGLSVEVLLVLRLGLTLFRNSTHIDLTYDVLLEDNIINTPINTNRVGI